MLRCFSGLNDGRSGLRHFEFDFLSKARVATFHTVQFGKRRDRFLRFPGEAAEERSEWPLVCLSFVHSFSQAGRRSLFLSDCRFLKLGGFL